MASETGYEPKPEETVSRSDYIGVMRMLVRRATLADRWRARRIKGHWLNQFRRELLIAGEPAWKKWFVRGEIDA